MKRLDPENLPPDFDEFFHEYTYKELLTAGVVQEADKKLVVNKHFDKTLEHFLRFLSNTGEIPADKYPLTEDGDTE